MSRKTERNSLVPSWTGYDNPDADYVGALTSVTGNALTAIHQQQTRMAETTEAEQLKDVRYYAGLLREAQDRLAATRAELRKLRDTPPATAYGEANATTDLEFIRRLPGVMGMKVDEDNRVVVHVRTGMVYGRRHYDFGDYEIALGPPMWGLCILDIVCTRYGGIIVESSPSCNCCERTTTAVGLYWSGSDSLGLGRGSFCFGMGARHALIVDLRDQGRCAEMLHVVIATMCSVNRQDIPRLSRIFYSTRLSRKERRALRAAGDPFPGLPTL